MNAKEYSGTEVFKFDKNEVLYNMILRRKNDLKPGTKILVTSLLEIFK